MGDKIKNITKKMKIWALVLCFSLFLIMMIISTVMDYVGKFIASLSADNENTVSSFTDTENVVYSFLKSKDLDNLHISAILGNMKAESGIDNTAVETIYTEPFTVGPKKHEAWTKDFRIELIDPYYASEYPSIEYCGIGLCQWTNGRNRYLVNLANLREKEWSDINVQLELFFMEFHPDSPKECGIVAHWNKACLEAFLLTQDITEATKLFLFNFEGCRLISEIEKRTSYSREYLSKIENGELGSSIDYVEYAKNIANDNSHGYCQSHRTGPDYDCSSFVYFVLVNTGNLPNTGVFSTANEETVLRNNGWTVLPYDPNGLKEGDILLNSGHTEIYIGAGQCVGAHIDASGSNTCVAGEGDQDGNEISITGNYGSWNYMIRK